VASTFNTDWSNDHADGDGDAARIFDFNDGCRLTVDDACRNPLCERSGGGLKDGFDDTRLIDFLCEPFDL